MKLPESTATRALGRQQRVERRRRACAGRCARDPGPARAPGSASTGPRWRSARRRRARWPGPPRSRPRPRRARSRPRRPSTARSTGRCAPSAAAVSSTWTTVAPSPSSAPWRVVHMVSDAPHATTRSASVMSSAARSVANPPEMPKAPGVAGEEAVRDGGGGEQGAAGVGERGQFGAGSAGAATGDEHRPVGVVEEAGELGDRAGVRAGRGQRRERGGAGSQGCSCTSRGRLSTTVRRRPRQVAYARRTSATADAAECTRSATAPTEVTSSVLVDAEVRPHRGTGGVGGQHEQRGAALRGLGDAGQGVGQAAALVQREHGDPAGGPRVRVGHRRRPALVAGRGERHAVRAQGVGDVEVAAADHAERVADAELGEQRADDVGDGGRRLREGRGECGAEPLTAPPARARAPGSPTRRRSAAGTRSAPRRWAGARRGCAGWSGPTCRAHQEVVARERRVEAVRRARVGADRLDAEAG